MDGRNVLSPFVRQDVISATNLIISVKVWIVYRLSTGTSVLRRALLRGLLYEQLVFFKLHLCNKVLSHCLLKLTSVHWEGGSHAVKCMIN